MVSLSLEAEQAEAPSWSECSILDKGVKRMSNILEIKDLIKVYSGGVRALQGVTLTVRQGEFFGLLGPNGAGKSTLIGILASLVNKTRGEVLVQGHSLDINRAQVKSLIGIVPQEFNFNFFEKASDILINQAGFYGISRKIAIPRAKKYLALLGLMDKANVTVKELSGGMKRRLMIARALMHEPEILILDEPTAGVDVEQRRDVWAFLKELNLQGRTIILTTHYIEEAEHLCERIAIIDKGRIIEQAMLKDILKEADTETIIIDCDKELEYGVKIPAGYSCKRLDETSVEIEFSREQGLNDLFKALSEQRVTVHSLRNKVNRLEAYFASKTGIRDIA